MFHAFGNNPITYTDPDGRIDWKAELKYAWQETLQTFNGDFGADFMLEAENDFAEGRGFNGVIHFLDACAEATLDVIFVKKVATLKTGMFSAGKSSSEFLLSINRWGNLSRAEEFGIHSYSELTKMITGTGLHAHHIIEQRLLKCPALQKLGLGVGSMKSVALTPAEHQKFTNAWRTVFTYGIDYNKLSVEEIWQAAQAIYAEYPELLKTSKEILGIE